MAVDRRKNAEMLQTAFVNHVRSAFANNKQSKKRKLHEGTQPIEMWSEQQVKLLAEESVDNAGKEDLESIVRFGFV